MNEVGNEQNWVSSTSFIVFQRSWKAKKQKKKILSFPLCRAPETVKWKPVLETPGRLPFGQPFQYRPSLPVPWRVVWCHCVRQEQTDGSVWSGRRCCPPPCWLVLQRRRSEPHPAPSAAAHSPAWLPSAPRERERFQESHLKPMYSFGKWWKLKFSLIGFVYIVVWVLRALWILLSETINILRKLHKTNPRKFYHRVMYIAPSSGHILLNFNMPFKLILRRFEVVFWCLEWECCTFWKIDGNSFKSTNTVLWL